MSTQKFAADKGLPHITKKKKVDSQFKFTFLADGLDNTKNWIKKAFDVVKSLQVSGNPTRNIRNVIITHAYLSLINNEGEKVYPEVCHPFVALTEIGML